MNIDGTSDIGISGEAENIIATSSIQLKDKYILPLDEPPAQDYIIKSTIGQQLVWTRS